jgi:ribA/ribD-fused uncharacterized protein
MSYYLFLDDSRKPHQVTWVSLPENVAWVSARSYTDFVYVISQMGIPKFVAYDCDLCQEHYDAYFAHREGYLKVYPNFKTKCGIDCVEYLIKLCKKNGVKHPDCIVHTQNNYTRGYIENMITAYNATQTKTLADATDIVVPSNAWDKQAQVPDYAKHDDERISGFFGQYRFLSNFWPAPVEWRGVEFPSVEVAYQAAKCADQKQMEDFVTLTASEAKKKGKSVIIRPNWDTERVKVMWHLVMQKFSKHPDLRNKLIGTGKRYLAEANAWKDKFWGVYYHFNQTTRVWDCYGGVNQLGTILMEVRDLIR